MLSWSLWERGQSRHQKGVSTKYAGIDWHEKTLLRTQRRSLHNAEQEGCCCCLFYLPFIPSSKRKEFVLFGRIFLLMKQNTENKSWQLNIYFLGCKDGKGFFGSHSRLIGAWRSEQSLLNWISCLSQIVIANATQKEILDSSICST